MTADALDQRHLQLVVQMVVADILDYKIKKRTESGTVWPATVFSLETVFFYKISGGADTATMGALIRYIGLEDF